jgi:hypothetical protein
MSYYREQKKLESEKTMKKEKIIHHDIVNHMIELLIKGNELIIEYDNKTYYIDCLATTKENNHDIMNINAIFSLRDILYTSKRYLLSIFFDNSFKIENLIPGNQNTHIHIQGMNIIATGNMVDLNIYRVLSC